MKARKQLISIGLVLVLVLTMLPAAVFAAEKTEALEENIRYNLHKQEITLGESGEETDTYKVFAADGSYTIQLEENAFFPYEVQFIVGEKKTVETFRTPDSTVNVGGRTFRVQSDPGAVPGLEQFGIWIAGEYIAAKPKPKVFSNAAFSPFSNLPLTIVYANLDLTSFDYKQLASVQVSTLLTQAAVPSGVDVLMRSSVDDSYTVIQSGDTIDFRDISRLELIVGTKNQLDATNNRYIISVAKNDVDDITLELYSQGSDGTRTSLDERWLYSYREDIQQYISFRIPKGLPRNAEYYLNIKNNTSSTYLVYKGAFATPEEAANTPGADITAQVVKQTMTNPNAGYKADFSQKPVFTLVVKSPNNVVAAIKTFQINVSNKSEYITSGSFYQEDASGYLNYVSSGIYFSDAPGNVERETYTFHRHKADAEYFFYFRAYDETESNNPGAVTKAVVGHYDSLQAAQGQPDIKAKLFTNPYYDTANAYKANFKNGINFTIFAFDKVYKYTIIAAESEQLESPLSGSTDFEVYSAENYYISDFYSVPSTDDSYNKFNGYQTLLANSSTIDLAALAPEFTTRNSIKIFSQGLEQKSGVNPQNFSGGPVQYSASAENGRALKNYWVSFVKKEAGAKLFVNGPDKREVFFNDYYGKYHDVFVANVGDATLTGITAEIVNPVNIKLDEYWTVGGAGNDTLADFSSTNTGSYSELANVGKVRLVPNGEGVISGTLKISSAAGSREIELAGYAGNPKIITTDLVGGTKFVPYSFLVQTNNIHDWITVSFRLANRNSLPEGLSLLPSGEIYGVPREFGDFPITVIADFGDDFSRSEVDFVLKISDNTDANVDAATDIGYEVMRALPRNITSLGDQVFQVKGEYKEFIDFWIDGVKLTDGVDYDSSDGSTIVTIRSQTLGKFGKGSHTIAAEFRVGGQRTNDLKRAAQNYTLNLTGSGGTTTESGSGSGSGEKSSYSKRSGSTTADTRQQAPPATRQTSVAEVTAQNRKIFKLQNIDAISLEELQKFAKSAQEENKVPVIFADTISKDGKFVEVRIEVNPALAETGLNLAASVSNKLSLATQRIFEKFFSNTFLSVVSFTQDETFGQQATVCVKLTEKVELDELEIYSYNVEKNTYTKLDKTGAWIDQNGYLHFNTTLSHDIVISQGELVRK